MVDIKGLFSNVSFILKFVAWVSHHEIEIQKFYVKTEIWMGCKHSFFPDIINCWKRHAGFG